MLLSDVVKRILDGGKLTQAELAEAMFGSVRHQSKVSEILRGRSTWEKHWRVFMRLLPLMNRYDLINEHDLIGSSHHEPHPNQSGPKTGKTPNSLRK